LIKTPRVHVQVQVHVHELFLSNSRTQNTFSFPIKDILSN